MMLYVGALFWKKSIIIENVFLFILMAYVVIMFDVFKKFSFPSYSKIQLPTHLFKTNSMKQTCLELHKHNNYMLQWATQFKNHPHLTIYHSTQNRDKICRCTHYLLRP